MVLKELPGKKASSEGNPLFTMTTKVGITTMLVCYLRISFPFCSVSFFMFVSRLVPETLGNRDFGCGGADTADRAGSLQIYCLVTKNTKAYGMLRQAKFKTR